MSVHRTVLHLFSVVLVMALWTSSFAITSAIARDAADMPDSVYTGTGYARSGAASAPSGNHSQPRQSRRTGPLVVRFNGLFDIFWRGTSQMAYAVEERCDAEIIERASHGEIRAAIRRGRKIVVIGHSIGGPQAVSFAESIAPTPVHLVLTFDPRPETGDKPTNVRRFVNFYGPWFDTRPRGAINIESEEGHIGAAQGVNMRRAVREICALK